MSLKLLPKVEDWKPSIALGVSDQFQHQERGMHAPLALQAPSFLHRREPSFLKFPPYGAP